MKKLTQKEAEHAPEWAKSMAVDENGIGFYHSLTAEELTTTRGQWWPKNHIDYNHYVMGVMTGEKKTGSYLDAIKFDATDWQNSAIDIEAIK